MERKLRQVEELPGEQAELLLGLPADAIPAGAAVAAAGLEELDLELDAEDGVTA
jgi:hypothetical protein